MSDFCTIDYFSFTCQIFVLLIIIVAHVRFCTIDYFSFACQIFVILIILVSHIRFFVLLLTIVANV